MVFLFSFVIDAHIPTSLFFPLHAAKLRIYTHKTVLPLKIDTDTFKKKQSSNKIGGLSFLLNSIHKGPVAEYIFSVLWDKA